MIKCPHCGSTAQVKRECEPFIRKGDTTLVEGFSCGCGCHFSHEYKRSDEGFWRLYWICEDYNE